MSRPGSRDNDPLDVDWKDVVSFADPAITLQELIALMCQTGFWFNPNLRPDFPHLQGHFTSFLPHLARCRMLVQCNPATTPDEVHHWILWDGGGSARIRAACHVPINGEAAFLDHDPDAGSRWWQHLRHIIHDAVDLKPNQRWLRYYRLTVSYDGRNERLLRIVHLGCHALTACAFFLAPNRLIPDRITDFGRTKR